jgi:antitoxin (DNA-binding transcriptional repressor) of toxin-antitoxin stability system
MEEVNISTFKATCLALLEKVRKTRQSILVLKRGEPIAQVIPPPLPDKPVSWLGSMKETGTIEGNIVSPVLDEGEWEVLKS